MVQASGQGECSQEGPLIVVRDRVEISVTGSRPFILVPTKFICIITKFLVLP